MKKAIVIGSGFGGLAIAIRLQARGYAVTILEKNQRLGGHAYQLKKDGYTFDMGPSLITAPDIISGVFAAAGRRMQDYLELIKLDPAYRIYYHDKTFLDYTDNGDRMKAEMAKFNTHDAGNYDRFMAHCRKFYEAVIKDGLGATPFMDLRTMFNFIPKALRLNALSPATSFVSKFFRDPRHQFAFSFHPLFIGGNPFRAPSLYLMIPYLEKTGGVWFTKGGMYSLVEAFEELFRDLGGKVMVDSEVKRIIVVNGKVTGVRTEAGLYPADLVVSNADWAHTNLDLVHEHTRPGASDKRIRNLDYSMSAFLLYLGTRKQYPELLHHTLILSERYRELITDIFDRKHLPDDFSMYLHAPTRTDPSMAPPGGESMYVLVPVPNLKGGQRWAEIKHSYADKIIDFLESFGMTDLRKNIEVQEIFTPEDFKISRNSFLGACWGPEPKLTQTAYFRPHNRSRDIPNLYFVGAGTHPGGGLPGVLLSAETTENVIRKDFGDRMHLQVINKLANVGEKHEVLE